MEQQPRYFAFAITNRCQSRCATCNGWQTPQELRLDELSTNDWKFVLSSLQKWLGSFDFIFSGGEPFLRNDILELADYAASIGLIPKVITNALALHNKCKEVINSKFRDITISLNSVTDPEIHNKSRGLPNAFKITSDVIQNLCYLNRKKKAGKTILIASVIMPSNLTELVPLAEFAHTNNIGINYQLLDGGESFFTAYDIYTESLKMYGEMKKQTVEAINKLITLKEKGYLIYNSNNQLEAFKDSILNSSVNSTIHNNSEKENICHNSEQKFTPNYSTNDIFDKIAPDNINQINVNELSSEQATTAKNCSECQIGNYNFLIDPYGNVRVCFSFEPIGSMRTDSPEKIWNSEEAEKIRKKIANCNKSCKLLNCNYHGEGD